MSNQRELLPLLPVRSMVLLPGVTTTVEVGRSISLRAVEAALSDDNLLLIVPQLDPDTRIPHSDDLFHIGVLAEINEESTHSRGHKTIEIRTLARFEIEDYIQEKPFFVVQCQPLKCDEVDIADVEEKVEFVQQSIVNLISESDDSETGQLIVESSLNELIDVAVSLLDLPRKLRLALLEETNLKIRLDMMLPPLEDALQLHTMRKKIKTEIIDTASKEAREHALREQMRSIREELGEISPGRDIEGELEEYLHSIAESKMSDEARTVARREVARMKHMPTESGEFTVSSTYLDWLLEYPWGIETEDTLDVGAARAILDSGHAGLEKVKKRILEFIAVRKLAPHKQGPILCLVGPPGVGKTSLGRAIATAIGREYVRAALGGVRDESTIRGHRRTYVGALPGRIISSIKKAGTVNPVFVLDEIDKLGSSHQGDPTSALLEVLDPVQNKEFVDAYFDVPADLSKVMFIATANRLDTIPDALLDRLEVIEVPGYTELEKFEIAKKHLLAKQLIDHGLDPELIIIDDSVIKSLIMNYTRESGVRNLERELGSICRSIAVKIAGKKIKLDEQYRIMASDLFDILGPIEFTPEIASNESLPGVATGLAWSPVGGSILFIEARLMPGKGNLTLTGKLGDIMKESATAAISYIRAHADLYDIDQDVFKNKDIHLHIPSGAISKDGPSAGVTLVTALVSLLTNRPVRYDLAMTGETTLRGIVLPVGGIKEKVLAAQRAGIKVVALPERNRKDLVDIPAETRKKLDIRFISKLSEVLEIAFSKPEDDPKRDIDIGVIQAKKKTSPGQGNFT